MSPYARRIAAAHVVAVAVVALAGCTADDPPTDPSSDPAASQAAEPPPSGSMTAPDEPGPAGPTDGPADGPSDAPDGEPAGPAYDPVSLPAMAEQDLRGGDLRLVDRVGDYGAYIRWTATYRSNDLTISAIVHVPDGRGPFPALVLAHGYIDPAYYVTGQGLSREQDWLARAGFLVLHTDYRNHAGSDPDPTNDLRMRLGYTADVVNAVQALRSSRLPVDDDRIGLLGRSMGGGVVQNVLVTRPGLVDAGVVFASVSSRTQDNFQRWTVPDASRERLEQNIRRRYGSPADSPRFWRQVSPRTYVDRITEPVLVHHGTADSTCPIRWSRETVRAMRSAGVDVRYAVWPGEEHAFYDAWPDSMRRTVGFLRATLRG